MAGARTGRLLSPREMREQTVNTHLAAIFQRRFKTRGLIVALDEGEQAVVLFAAS
jgi:hypothetical protein